MSAQFKVSRSFLLPSRSLFVLAGAITEGAVRPGMFVLIPFNRSASKACSIEGVEFLRSDNLEEIALTVRYEEPDEGAFLQTLDISDEFLVISDHES